MDGQNSKDDCNFPPISRKRRHFDDDDCKDEDCAASAPKILIEEPPFCLLDFCDEILLEIFKNLDSNSLFSIGQTCHRLYRLIADYRLWKTIDLTSEELPQKTIRKRLKPMHTHTNSIAIRGLTGTFPKDSWNNITMGNTLLRDITETCESLQVLELHHSFLNFEYMAITDFPKNIKRLVFNNCFVRWPKAPHAFFTRIDTHLDNLEELILEYCNWFETHDLVLFSKIPFLKKLSLRGCMNLKECVPYGSIATRFGFKSLEHLDVRDTLISDSDIQCFNITYTLKELLLECPDDIRDMDSSNSREPRDSRDQRDPRDPRGPRDPRDPRNHGESPPPRPVRPIFYAAPANNPPGNGEENNVVHIVIHDRSIINVRGPGRLIPNIEVNLEPDPPQNNANENNASNRAEQSGDAGAAVRQIPDINRAISQSLWFERRYPPPFSPPRIYPISDRGILCFGAPRNIAHANIIWIRAEPRPVDNNLERLTVRHYKLVTDISLTHLAQCSPKLVFLDLTGTAVTKAGLERFKVKKPDCFVVSDHFTG